jgi:hypothetical protein
MGQLALSKRLARMGLAAMYKEPLFQVRGPFLSIYLKCT